MRDMCYRNFNMIKWFSYTTRKLIINLCQEHMHEVRIAVLLTLHDCLLCAYYMTDQRRGGHTLPNFYVFMLINSEKEKGKKKNIKKRMVACRSHTCSCSVARLSPNSWLVSFVAYNSYQQLFALRVNRDRGYLH